MEEIRKSFFIMMTFYAIFGVINIFTTGYWFKDAVDKKSSEYPILLFILSIYGAAVCILNLLN